MRIVDATLCGVLARALLAAGIGLAGLSAGHASEDGAEIHRQHWHFSGLFGRFDQAQLQRGYQVYKDVCASCHSMRLLSFRNLAEKGGPAFPEEGVRALAATFQIEDGPNDSGKMFKRAGVPSDRFPSPFANDQQARAANNGALPPDLSLMAKARGVENEAPFYLVPFHWVRDILTSYQEGGPDYIYAVLTGYGEAPKDMKMPDGAPLKMAEGMNFNHAFPGYQIAMPPPLSDKLVKYSDGSPATLKQYAEDVAAFLMWAAEPKLEQRKSMGISVLIYLLVTCVLMFIAKRRIWARVPH